MKVIDLLNKIANEEEVPEKIKYNNIVYHRQWSDYMGDEPIDEYYIDDNNFSWMTEMDLKLDSEVKIIEESKLEKIPEVEIATSMAIGEKICARKINEIIDYINKENK